MLAPDCIIDVIDQRLVPQGHTHTNEKVISLSSSQVKTTEQKRCFNESRWLCHWLPVGLRPFLSVNEMQGLRMRRHPLPTIPNLRINEQAGEEIQETKERGRVSGAPDKSCRWRRHATERKLLQKYTVNKIPC